jgi:hypothetical protein
MCCCNLCSKFKFIYGSSTITRDNYNQFRLYSVFVLIVFLPWSIIGSLITLIADLDKVYLTNLYNINTLLCDIIILVLAIFEYKIIKNSSPSDFISSIKQFKNKIIYVCAFLTIEPTILRACIPYMQMAITDASEIKSGTFMSTLDNIFSNYLVAIFNSITLNINLMIVLNLLAFNIKSLLKRMGHWEQINYIFAIPALLNFGVRLVFLHLFGQLVALASISESFPSFIGYISPTVFVIYAALPLLEYAGYSKELNDKQKTGVTYTIHTVNFVVAFIVVYVLVIATIDIPAEFMERVWGRIIALILSALFSLVKQGLILKLAFVDWYINHLIVHEPEVTELNQTNNMVNLDV